MGDSAPYHRDCLCRQGYSLKCLFCGAGIQSGKNPEVVIIYSLSNLVIKQPRVVPFLWWEGVGVHLQT